MDVWGNSTGAGLGLSPRASEGVQLQTIQALVRYWATDYDWQKISTLERYNPTDAAHQDYLASFEGERLAESMRYVRSYPSNQSGAGC